MIKKINLKSNKVNILRFKGSALNKDEIKRIRIKKGFVK